MKTLSRCRPTGPAGAPREGERQRDVRPGGAVDVRHRLRQPQPGRARVDHDDHRERVARRARCRSRAESETGVHGV